jgi:hypothetical protein
MTGRLGMTRSLAAVILGLGLTAGVSAQHPYLGQDYPAQDPRSASVRSLQGSDSRAVEFGYREGIEGCAFRAQTLRGATRPYMVDEWALGVERYDGKANLFFEVRVIDAAGGVLAIERPTLYMFGSGPTYDWQPGRSRHEAYVRIEKEVEQATSRELVGITTAVQERGIRELAITLPDGRGDAYIALHDGATPRQVEFFGGCVCYLLGIDGNDLFPCP